MQTRMPGLRVTRPTWDMHDGTQNLFRENISHLPGVEPDSMDMVKVAPVSGVARGSRGLEEKAHLRTCGTAGARPPALPPPDRLAGR